MHSVAMLSSEQYPEALRGFNHQTAPRLLGKSDDIYSPRSNRLIDKNLAEAIMRLNKLVKASLLVSYKNGYRDGREIMFDLAAGDITIRELNDRSMRIEREEAE